MVAQRWQQLCGPRPSGIPATGSPQFSQIGERGMGGGGAGTAARPSPACKEQPVGEGSRARRPFPPPHRAPMADVSEAWQCRNCATKVRLTRGQGFPATEGYNPIVDSSVVGSSTGRHGAPT